MKKTLKALCAITLITVLPLTGCRQEPLSTYSMRGIAFDVPASWDTEQYGDDYEDYFIIKPSDTEIVVPAYDFTTPTVARLANKNTIKDYLGLDYGYDVPSVTETNINGIDAVDARLNYLGSSAPDGIYLYRVVLVEGDGGVIGFIHGGQSSQPQYEKEVGKMINSIRVK